MRPRLSDRAFFAWDVTVGKFYVPFLRNLAGNERYRTPEPIAATKRNTWQLSAGGVDTDALSMFWLARCGRGVTVCEVMLKHSIAKVTLHAPYLTFLSIFLFVLVALWSTDSFRAQSKVQIVLSICSCFSFFAVYLRSLRRHLNLMVQFPPPKSKLWHFAIRSFMALFVQSPQPDSLQCQKGHARRFAYFRPKNSPDSRRLIKSVTILSSKYILDVLKRRKKKEWV